MNTSRSPVKRRTAVVTGGSSGIGLAVCRTLAAAGMDVLITARNRERLEWAVQEIHRDGGRAVGIVADLLDPGECDSLRVRASEYFGPAEVVVTLAGGDLNGGPLWETPVEDWRSTLDSNLTSSFLTLRAFIPHMLQIQRGCIVTMSSTAARKPTSASAAYTAAKAGVIALTRQLAHDLGPYGIRANCVVPSIITTPTQLDKMSPGDEAAAVATTPLRRLGTAQDVADATLFLCSEQSSWITGVALDVAGGRYLP